ncbi:hypothetical protein SAMN04487948_1207 [Halogranum amylolyticum]|uniref:GIY-YIG domain-containing protein n=1 Tax=Halogranum amylolyticum TaxID=660520 RepID=A0A1H8VVC4_9EURY|nr:GIY-YIG nuclease family protein [Halogranum amylolyticum]SEP19315.1 hypothetical protein SAMN04487948_1207 [Halogranum amylolyticum]
MDGSKRDLWTSWIDQTLLADIHDPDRPDPVAFLETVDGELTTTDALDRYRYGKNDGEYLYLIYLADEPIENTRDITPVYVGESRNIGSRIYQHYKKIKAALPINDWEDDGSWGSFSKYDHLAAVRAMADSELYVWILDVDALETCPYGVETYRQELEAKLVGLIYAHPEFRRTLTNREFVPNRIHHEISKVGPNWLTGAGLSTERWDTSVSNSNLPTSSSKPELWTRWLDSHVWPDFDDDSTVDPIPLFETDEDRRVVLTDNGRLKRSVAIDERIRREGQKCVHPEGVTDDGYEGLLYMLYQLTESDQGRRPTIVPRYIGKAEAYGKKLELSSNFEEIAKDRAGTKSFARWGDGDYWHVGELSMALFEDDTRKVAWASELFEQGTHQLTDQTYLWVRAWNQDHHTGPYGYNATLAEVEPQLIGLAHAAFPSKLLNKSDVPDDAPIKQTEFTFETVSQ